MLRTSITIVSLGVLLAACSYRPYAGNVKPLGEEHQAAGVSVADDGTVTHKQGRLEIRLRPMSDEELNRQFAINSQQGARSTNPYTFGNSKYFMTGETPRRFTVFKLSVKNYEYPKVRLAGDMVMASSNGRKYYALTLQQLDTYYRTYALAYRGNEYFDYKQRRSILKSTSFPPRDIFSGQEEEGFIVFKPLADDVEDISVTIEDIVVRFDFRGEPAESIEASFQFERDVGVIYPDGRIDLSSQ